MHFIIIVSEAATTGSEMECIIDCCACGGRCALHFVNRDIFHNFTEDINTLSALIYISHLVTVMVW